MRQGRLLEEIRQFSWSPKSNNIRGTAKILCSRNNVYFKKKALVE